MANTVPDTLPPQIIARVWLGDQPIDLTAEDFGPEFAEARAQGSLREPDVDAIGRALDAFLERTKTPAEPVLGPGPIEPTPGPIQPAPAPIVPRPSPIATPESRGLIPLRDALAEGLLKLSPAGEMKRRGVPDMIRRGADALLPKLRESVFPLSGAVRAGIEPAVQSDTDTMQSRIDAFDAYTPADFPHEFPRPYELITPREDARLREILRFQGLGIRPDEDVGG